MSTSTQWTHKMHAKLKFPKNYLRCKVHFPSVIFSDNSDCYRLVISVNHWLVEYGIMRSPADPYPIASHGPILASVTSLVLGHNWMGDNIFGKLTLTYGVCVYTSHTTLSLQHRSNITIACVPRPLFASPCNPYCHANKIAKQTKREHHP